MEYFEWQGPFKSHEGEWHGPFTFMRCEWSDKSREDGRRNFKNIITRNKNLYILSDGGNVFPYLRIKFQPYLMNVNGMGHSNPIGMGHSHHMKVIGPCHSNHMKAKVIGIINGTGHSYYMEVIGIKVIRSFIRSFKRSFKSHEGDWCGHN